MKASQIIEIKFPQQITAELAIKVINTVPELSDRYNTLSEAHKGYIGKTDPQVIKWAEKFQNF